MGGCSKEGYVAQRISLLKVLNVIAVRDSRLRLEELRYVGIDVPGSWAEVAVRAVWAGLDMADVAVCSAYVRGHSAYVGGRSAYVGGRSA